MTPPTTEATHVASPDVTTYPMLVLDTLVAVGPPTGCRIRLLHQDDPDLAAARAVAEVGFAHAGTAAGSAGTAEREAAARCGDPLELTALRERISRGRTVLAVAVCDDDGVVGSGMLTPVPEVADVAEIVGVAVLPAYRRRGIGAALTAALAGRAGELGIEVVMLTAATADLARGYERLGFVLVGPAGQVTAADMDTQQRQAARGATAAG